MEIELRDARVPLASRRSKPLTTLVGALNLKYLGLIANPSDLRTYLWNPCSLQTVHLTGGASYVIGDWGSEPQTERAKCPFDFRILRLEALGTM